MEETNKKERSFSFGETLKKHLFRIIAAILLASVSVAGIYSVRKNTKVLSDPTAFAPDTPQLPDASANDLPEAEKENIEDIPANGGNKENTQTDSTQGTEFIPVGEIRIPQCADITYSLETKRSDFYFENPSSNSCFLKVSIVRLDTDESIYSSSQISPGNSISGISFISKITKPGIYPIMIKIDAYALDRMLYLNSLAIDTLKITAY